MNQFEDEFKDQNQAGKNIFYSWLLDWRQQLGKHWRFDHVKELSERTEVHLYANSNEYE